MADTIFQPLTYLMLNTSKSIRDHILMDAAIVVPIITQMA